MASVPQTLTPQTSDAPADLSDLDRLRRFRSGWYDALDRWSDTLFEIGDALLTTPGRVRSLPYLSIEPACRRGHRSRNGFVWSQDRRSSVLSCCSWWAL